MKELAARILARRLTYQSPARLELLIETVEQVNAAGVAGDLAEFGMALGGSAICIAGCLLPDQRFYGFDNFAMIPQPGPVDGEEPNARYEIIKSGQSEGIEGDPYYGYEQDRLALVTGRFAEFGLPVDGTRISLIPGLFEDTLPQALPGPLAFAHVDCDWYSPVKTCLDAIHLQLTRGATVLVDDYNHWEGCTRAVNEFCAARPDIEFTEGRRYALLVKR